MARDSRTLTPVISAQRWQALDHLRGLSIFFMLLNLNVGAWDHVYRWLEHTKWAGGTFIDLVAPAFLFCIGAALPLSFRRRMEDGATRANLIRHALVRAALLVAIGVFLNAYPRFDLTHLRLPGVLQRIGLTYGIVASFVLVTAKSDGMVNGHALVSAVAVILVSYFALLEWVPVPGFGAPRFDPVGSWPAVIDRAVFTTNHMFPWWPVDGRVVFDPEGILSTWPACTNILVGALVGSWHLTAPRRPVVIPLALGVFLMMVALTLNSFCPIIKNIWTSTFALFTCGFSLSALGGLTALERSRTANILLYPAKVFGYNALSAYILSFLAAPLIDAALLPDGYNSIRHGLFLFFARAFSPNLASLTTALVFLAIILTPLIVCYHRRWSLKL